jgi:alpha-N-acetylglucosamine transferase
MQSGTNHAGHEPRTGVGTHAQAVGTHTSMQKILYFDGLDPKYVYFNKLDQNLLHSTIPNAKSFASRRS